MHRIITRIILFSGLILAGSFLYGQNTEDDCTLIIDFGQEDTSPWAVWSWSSADFPIISNPLGDWPQEKVRSWQKGGGWSGFGSTKDNFVETDGFDSIAVWIYSEKDSIKSMRIEVKNIADEIEQKAEYQYINELGIPLKTWKLLKFPISDMFELADFTAFNSFLIQPDGTNDTNRWIKNYYYVGSMYLERDGACPTTPTVGVRNKDLSRNDNLFYVSNNTIHIVGVGIKSIDVYSMAGTRIWSVASPEASTLSLSEAMHGLYIIRAIDHDNRVIRQKIIVK